MKRDKSRLEEALSTAVSDTIESMVFEQCYSLSEDGDEDDGGIAPAVDDIWVSMPFIAPYEGSVTLAMSQEAATTITMGVLGEVEGLLASERIQDTLSEILNTVVGELARNLTGPGNSFEFGLPVAGDGIPPDIEEAIIILDFRVGEYIIQVSLAGSDFEKFR